MAYKIFCDTNVIIDFFSDDRPNHDAAVQLFDLIQRQKIHGFISETAITNAAYILRKWAPVTLLKQNFSVLLLYFDVLSNTSEICSTALKSTFNDIEDAILYHLALHHQLDYFITENIRDFKEAIPQLPVYNTASFLWVL